MKIIVIVLWNILLCSPTLAQKQRMEDDNSNFLCLNDSLAHMQINNLQQNNVDSIIDILYDFDNGRMQNSKRVILWTKNAISHIALFEGCSSIRKDTSYVIDLTFLWKYIARTHFDDLSVPVTPKNYHSHDYIYHITINVSGKEIIMVIADSQRARAKPDDLNVDSRIVLANKIDALIK